MTDDLFDDFDLKPVTQPRKEITANDIQENLTDSKTLEKTEKTSELSSENLHPDIFDGIDSENDGNLTDDGNNTLETPFAEETQSDADTFSFDSVEKEPFETAVSAPVEMTPENIVVEVRRIDNIRRPDVAIDPENYGATLRRFREAACISLEELAEELRIKENFLAALEREDYENLPPEVYIIAYIRRLGGIYHLNNDEINLLTAKVKNRMEIDLPDDMEKIVIFNEGSEENEQKLHYILTFFAIAAIAVILAIAAGVYFFVSANRDSGRKSVSIPQKNKVENFSSDTLLKLQPSVKLDAPPLKITK